MAVFVYLALALAAFAAVSANIENPRCPAVACTLELRPGMVQKPSVMVYKNEVCTVCSTWIDPATKVDRKTGCPLIPCTMQALTRCSRNVYMSWSKKLCPVCTQEFC